MTAIALAVVAAVGWGASDFFGGHASRRQVPVFVVVATAELLGVVLLVPVLLARGTPPPLDPRLLLAALAGMAVTVELSLIYRALSRGEAFITAPTGALGTAAAVSVGLLGGDPLGLAVAIGLTLALLGGGISAWSSPAGARAGRGSARHAVASCLGAAAALGAMLTSLHAAGRLDPCWATAIEHASTGASAGLVTVIGTRRPVRHVLPDRPHWPALMLIATAGVGGDLAYASASRAGALSIVSAISSLYPVTTIALGGLLQGLRSTRIQLVGIVLALGGATLLGAATP
jgi:drug/metabolite transporter (DMT)-like permease